MENTFNSLLMLVIVSAVSTNTFANDGRYLETMQKNINVLYEAKAIPDYQAVVNSFERIASVEKTRWEPQYYAAFGYLMMSARETEATQKDFYIDQAMAAVEKAKEISADNAEIIALEGFGLMMRVSVDPGSRGAQLAGLSVQTFQKALAIEPENPRALILLAQMQFGTAQFFKSSTQEACETLSKGMNNFETFQSTNVLAPKWGMQMALGLKEQCK